MKRLILTSAAALAVLAGVTPAVAASPTGVQSSPLRFSVIQYNSPGSDYGSNASLNAEWVKITNTGSLAHTLTGFLVHDAAGHSYTFGTLKVGPHKTVTLHTGHGSNGTFNRYWQQGWYIWNNDGDTATLVSSSGSVVDRCSWSDPSENHAQKQC